VFSPGPSPGKPWRPAHKSCRAATAVMQGRYLNTNDWFVVFTWWGRGEREGWQMFRCYLCFVYAVSKGRLHVIHCLQIFCVHNPTRTTVSVYLNSLITPGRLMGLRKMKKSNPLARTSKGVFSISNSSLSLPLTPICAPVHTPPFSLPRACFINYCLLLNYSFCLI